MTMTTTTPDPTLPPFTIYVASSWRNEHQPAVVAALKANGFEVYDFRNPPSGPWDASSPWWANEQKPVFPHVLASDAREAAYMVDVKALRSADAVLLLLESGKSAHLEAGFAAGAGIPLVVLGDASCEPELMYGMAHMVTSDIDGAILYLQKVRGERAAQGEEGLRQIEDKRLGSILRAHEACVRFTAPSLANGFDVATLPKTVKVGDPLGEGLSLAGLGIAGEAGEVADLLKKVIHHGHPLTDTIYAKIVKEMGDVSWYLRYLGLILDITPGEVIEANMVKLRHRYPEGWDPLRSLHRKDDLNSGEE